jgi:hypothetical protein
MLKGENMSCPNDIAKAISDSIRPAESVYSKNKKARTSFIMSEDAQVGIDIVDSMVYDLDVWVSRLRRIKDAARSCRQNMQ